MIHNLILGWITSNKKDFPRYFTLSLVVTFFTLTFIFKIILQAWLEEAFAVLFVKSHID